MLTREQCRAIQKSGETVARQALTEAWSKEDKAAVELLAYGMLDTTGRVLSAYLGSEVARQIFQDMADRLAPPALVREPA